jgi:anti-sigma factor RsiW
MEAVRESWTDDRLDLLNEQVDRRFQGIDRRFDAVDRRLDRLEQTQQAILLRLDSMQRAAVFGAITLTGGMIAGFSAIVALVATQV